METQPPNRNVRILYLILLNLTLFAALLLWNRQYPSRGVQLAFAKSKQMLDLNAYSAPSLNANQVQDLLHENRPLLAKLERDEVIFVNSILLSRGEAQVWQEGGCGTAVCAHVTYYDTQESATWEIILNLDTGKVVEEWVNEAARPAGSSFILQQALEIASADPQVTAVLGDIGIVDPAMVPMSAWLADDACRDEWCVDLTFHDPQGNGRIFHVFVNMQRNEVARTFYTRGRPDRQAAKPVAQRFAFTDGCETQYGWDVCWEMTAHDGINFQDATFAGQEIFSSIKIGQVEAWYPSWPGGYRDEIGFNASVPPFGDTQVTDLGDGFEVRQLFTEFTHWPNCICCYRYEEVLRFFADGRFELEFVSHGPGCDDLSIYRPFWRIDLDLDGPENDNVWLWQETRWDAATVEFETYPVVNDVSPDGKKLATIDGDVSYRWHMVETDPLGLDEAYFFLLKDNEKEGAGPIITGPGDTYTPPRQWVNGDKLSGEDIVLWYVPLLNTKKGNPWWCAPDPEPDYSPCSAILIAEPAGELVQPSAAELAEATATAVQTPTTVPTPAPPPTPRPIDGVDAEEVILNSGCGACHQIGILGEGHKVGPDLSDIGVIAENRIAGMDAQTYIRQSILEPNDFLAPECPNGDCLANIMPSDYAARLTEAQLETLIAYLLTQEGAPATPVAIGAGETSNSQESVAAPKAFPAPKAKVRSIQPQQTAVRPGLLIQIFLLALVFLLTGWRLLKGSFDEE